MYYIIFILLAIVILFYLAFRKHLGNTFKLDLEHFTTSTADKVSSGASGAYNWGYQPIDNNNNYDDNGADCPRCGYHITININTKGKRSSCEGCDITKHPDIDKYVLKSSIPPYPNMDEYAKKNALCPCENKADYVKKNQLCGYNRFDPSTTLDEIKNFFDYSNNHLNKALGTKPFTPQAPNPYNSVMASPNVSVFNPST